MSEENSETKNEQTSSWMDQLMGTDGDHQQPNGEGEQQEKETTTEEVETDTKNNQENQQQQEKPIDVFAEFAKISNNEISSEESLNALLEKSRNYNDLESRYETLNRDFEATKSIDPFANDYIKKLNELTKTGDTEKIKLFQRVNAIGDVNSLTDFEAVSLMMQWKNDLTPEETDRLMKRNFKLDPEVHGEENVADSNIDLKIKAREAKQFLAEQQASVEVKLPETPSQEAQPTEAELKAKQEAKVKQVEPLVKSIEQDVPNFFIGVNTNGLKDDKAINIDLPVPEDVQKEVSQIVGRFAVNLDIDPNNEQHVAALKDFAKNTAKYLMYDKHIIEAANQREKLVRSEYQNPSNIKRDFVNPNAPKATDREQSASYVANNL